MRVIKTLPELMSIKPVLMDNAVAVAAAGRGRTTGRTSWVVSDRALGWLRAGLDQGDDKHCTCQVGRQRELTGCAVLDGVLTMVEY